MCNVPSARYTHALAEGDEEEEEETIACQYHPMHGVSIRKETVTTSYKSSIKNVHTREVAGVSFVENGSL